ncbi:hypothetical protein [Leptolyngbya sp. GB1-A1]|uniref:hypothetical protein n=1 Tax=Leptolyngbya sp. GB1-A1 TaxID=2933908 RepID=UPI00329A3BDD
MQHPFQVIPLNLSNLLLLLLTFLTVLFMVLLDKLGKPLKQSPRSPMGIVSLEFAARPADAMQMIQSWGNAIRNAKQIFWLDFPFLVLYSTALSLGCIWATRASSNPDWINAGVVLAWNQGLAGLFDIVENLAMSSFLFRNIQGLEVRSMDRLLTLTTVVSAKVKFSLIFLGLLYIVIAVGLRVFQIE